MKTHAVDHPLSLNEDESGGRQLVDLVCPFAGRNEVESFMTRYQRKEAIKSRASYNRSSPFEVSQMYHTDRSMVT